MIRCDDSKRCRPPQYCACCGECARKQEQLVMGVVLWRFIYLADFFLWNTSEERKELQVLSPCQQLINGIKLRAVAHVLMDFLDVGQDTVKEELLC